MTTTGTYNLGIKPVQRKDLMDYFPSLAGAFAGYIRQMVFRVTLTEVLTETQGKVEAEMAQVNYDGSLNPLLRDASYDAEMQRRKQDAYYTLFREFLSALIEQTDWYRWNNDESYAKRSEAEARRYTTAAAYAVPKHFINKGVGKVASNMGGKVLDKGMKKWKPVEKVGNFAKGYNALAERVEEATNKLVDISFDPMEKAVEEIHDYLGPDGVDTSFNNDDTRRFYAQLLHVDKDHEKYVGAGLWTLDTATDMLKYAEGLKLGEEVAINAFTAYLHQKDANRERAAIAERNEKWESLTEEIKQHIQQDIQSLTNEELTGLCKLLEVKQ